MNTLSFAWRAVLKDGSVIKQFEGEQENPFKLIQDNASKLRYFYLENTGKGIVFCVDMIDGVFSNGITATYPVEILKKDNLRLIYFRRNRKEFDSGMKELSHTTWYFLGYQYQDKDGQNHQFQVCIDSDGNFMVGE